MRRAQDQARSAEWKCAREAGRFFYTYIIKIIITISNMLNFPLYVNVQFYNIIYIFYYFEYFIFGWTYTYDQPSGASDPKSSLFWSLAEQSL